MPPNSITLDFKTMPTVTVDGKTHTFKKGEKEGEFKPIDENVGGVTYSLVKDKESGRYKMTITGEPKDLAKYNFGVSKGRVTDAKFVGSDSMENFFKGDSHVGDKKKAPKYFQSFSIGGAHLADRAAFLQSGAWGIDQNSASTELQRLEEEAKKKAETEKDSKTTPKPSNPAKKDPADSAQKPNEPAQDNLGKEKDTKIQAKPADNKNPPKVDDSQNQVGVVVNKTKEPVTFLSREILKDQAGELYDKVLAALDKNSELKKNPDFMRLAKSLHRYAEGSSLKSLTFANPETEKLFLSSASDYLRGLEGDIDTFSKPKDASLQLIENYSDKFQAACLALKESGSILQNEDISKLTNAQILSKLQPNEKKEVLELFSEFVNEANKSSVDHSSSNSPNTTQKSAELLKSLGLERKEVPDNGNCLFFAVSANEKPESDVSSFSNSAREANTARDKLLESIQKMSPEQAKKIMPGKEFFKTWDALQSGLPSPDQYLQAQDVQDGFRVDSSSWGDSRHLRLNAIRTGKPQVAIDAASNKVEVYFPSGNHKTLSTSRSGLKEELLDFISQKGAQVYEALPNHWNAVQVANG
jgi:hypothetical protein